MFRLGSVIVVILAVAQAGAAGQHPAEAPALPRGAVTVFHSVDLVKLIRRLKEQGSNYGLLMPSGQNPINITTGLVLDDAGHIITRLVNLDPEDKDQDLTIWSAEGLQLKAKLVGVDCPTGFAILEVDPGSRLGVASAAAGPVDEGIQVKLFSSDLGRNAKISGDTIRFSPEVVSFYGKIARGTLFSKARGALTLESIEVTSRNDSGIVETLDNKVVGMAQSAGLSAGMAYVFPYEFLRRQVLARVLDHGGTVPAGWLGVVPEAVTGSSRGVVVKEIQPQSTAEVCGLQARDIIVGLDQYDISGQADMVAVLSAMPAGSKVRVRALRNQTSMEVEAVLGAQRVHPILPGVPAAATPHAATSAMPEERLAAGFIVREMTSQLAGYFGVQKGVLVTEVSKGGAADKAGLTAGDVLVGIDDRELGSLLELKTLLSGQAKAFKLRVYRNKSSVAVNLPNPAFPNVN